MATRHRWTAQQLEQLRQLFPHQQSAKVATTLNLRLHQVNGKARQLGLRKTAEYLATPDACRLRRDGGAGSAHRFPKGHVPANKGKRMPGFAPGRMGETQFKKGQWPVNKDPGFYVIGALRVNSDGYIDIRTSFELGAKGWTPLHRFLWEREHGPIPAGHKLVFKDRDRLNVELANLELLTNAEAFQRNSLHNKYPPEVRKLIITKGHITRHVRRIEREHHERQH